MPTHDLLIIGAGPGGYVAAIRAAQLGMDVACVDENEALGGTCLRVGCIPSKALLESSHRYDAARNELKAHGVKVGEVSLDLAAMLKRKERIVETLTKGIAGLFKKNKITHYQGRGSFEAPGRVSVQGKGGESQTIEATRIIIATGSVPASLPGIEIDGDRIGDSTAALRYADVPERLIVIGAGYIGLELGSVWNRLGSHVTVLEYLDRVLPGMDGETAAQAQKIFSKQGLTFRLQSKVTAAKVEKDACIVESEGAEPLEADRVLVAVGRKPNTEHLGLDKVGLEVDERGFIPVDDSFQATEGIYAIGDVIGGVMLAHKAEEEGVACVEKMAGGGGHVDYAVIPAVVFTHPEIASVGRTEEQLQEASVDYRKGVFPFQGNGRARTLGEAVGQVKILADKTTDRVLGVHIIGPTAGELIAEAAAAMSFGASSEDIARTCHSHPTLAEAVKEAALAVDGRPLHI